MTSVVFSTPGLIPLESFQTFGVNAKPSTPNPIGYFGTGLKYAIAVCLRFKQEVVIWRGQDKYTFYTKDKNFRDKEFSFVRMKLEKWFPGGMLRRKAQYFDLPFTTELGKNWELWQAFREFETNTRDENGETNIWNEQNPWHKLDELLDARYPVESTHIMVEGQKFVDEFHDRERNFLPDGLSEREGSDRIQVLDRPSKHIYYRGMRIMDLKEESEFTYNFVCHVELTEDRTAKYPSVLEAMLAEHIVQNKEPSYIDRVVPHSHYAGPSRYEHSLPLQHSYSMPSTTFLDAARVSKRSEVRELWDKHQPTVRTKTRLTIEIPKSGLSDDELLGLANHIRHEYSDAQLIDEEFKRW